MSKVIGSAPCPVCDDKYGYTTNPEIVKIYEKEDGRIDATCFSCKNWWPRDIREDKPIETKTTQTEPKMPVASLRIGSDPARKISPTVDTHYGTKVSMGPSGDVTAVHYPLHREGGGKTSWKTRTLPKKFSLSGGNEDLMMFGQGQGGGRRLIITEGEEDALAVAESYHQYKGTIWPVVSIQSSTHLEQVAKQRSYIRSFDEIILWFDNDDAGKEATAKVAKIIGFDKTIKVAAGMEKDASDEYRKHGFLKTLTALWNAPPYSPQDILTSIPLWEQLKAYNSLESFPYPKCFQGLNDMIKGMRAGEITLWTSGTGVGKSTMLREIALHLVEQGEKIGIISLEESPAETARKMSAMAIHKNPATEDLTLEELQPGFDKVFGDDQCLVLDHAGAITAGIVSQMQYMAAVGCKYLFIDHITILVSEGHEGNAGNEAIDKMMNDILKVAKTYNIWIGLISHLRKTSTMSKKSFEQGLMPTLDDIKGSGSIKQVAMDIIAFARNMEGGENRIEMQVLKCRTIGETGPCGVVSFDKSDGRIVYGESFTP